MTQPDSGKPKQKNRLSRSPVSSGVRIGVSPHTHVSASKKKSLENFLNFAMGEKIQGAVESVAVQQLLLNQIFNLEIDILRRMQRYPADAFLDPGRLPDE